MYNVTNLRGLKPTTLLLFVVTLCVTQTKNTMGETSLLGHTFVQQANRSPSMDEDEGENDIGISYVDDDLDDYAIYDGSGDYSSRTESIFFTTPEGPIVTAFITVESPVYTLKERTDNDRQLLRGDPGPPGRCECDLKELSRTSKGNKGEAGETKYVVKLIGKDLPPIRSEVFKEALKQVIAMGLKGEKGDQCVFRDKYKPDDHFVTASRFSSFRDYQNHLKKSDRDLSLPELVVVDNSHSVVQHSVPDDIYLRLGDRIHKIVTSQQHLDISRPLQVSQTQQSSSPRSLQEPNEILNLKQFQRDSANRRERENHKIESEDRMDYYNRSSGTHFNALTLMRSSKINTSNDFNRLQRHLCFLLVCLLYVVAIVV